MKLKDIRKYVRNMCSFDNIDEYDKLYLLEIKKIVTNGFKIKVSKKEVQELLLINYRLNNRFLDDYITELIKDNNIDLKDYLLKKESEVY